MIDAVSSGLVVMLRDSLPAGRGAPAVSLATADSLTMLGKGPRVDVLLHRVALDAAHRNAPGPTAARSSGPGPARLGYVLMARASKPEAEHRLLSQVLAAVVKNPVLDLAEAGPWRLTIDNMPDEQRFPLLEAMRTPLRPLICVEATGVLGG